MKKLILIYLALFPIGSQAQIIDNNPWCPDGARWVYFQTTSSCVWYRIYSYSHDTVIESKNCKVIKANYVEFCPNQSGAWNRANYNSDMLHYLHQSNDSIFVWHDNEFKFIYQFNPQINQEFIVNNYTNNNCNPTFPDDTLLVSSVEDYVHNNLIYKRYYIQSHERWQIGRLINKIGGDEGLLPSAGETNDPCRFEITYDLHCYSDNLRGSVYYSNSAENGQFNCHYVVTSVEENFSSQPVTTYPNPVKDELFIDNLTNKKCRYIILDINGRIIEEFSNEISDKIDVRNLNTGIYFLRIEFENAILNVKFIKE